MSCENYLLKGIRSLNETQIMNGLELNLKTWLDWALLKVGGFTNIEGETEGINGGDWSILRLVKDPAYIEGRVWESAKKDWVWEGDITHIDPDSAEEFSPLEVALYIDGSLVPDTDYIVNYPLGRIILDTAVDVESEVRATYSFRQIQVYVADQADWWNELQFRSFNVEDSYFLQQDGGTWSIGAHHRIQMPCILIEAAPRTRSRGYQVGDGSFYLEQDVLCYVLAESRQSRNRIMDILRNQFDKNLQLFNVDNVALAGDFPLDYAGTLLDSTKTFPVLSDAYPWKRCRFIRTDCTESMKVNPRLFSGLVRLTCEMIIDD